MTKKEKKEQKAFVIALAIMLLLLTVLILVVIEWPEALNWIAYPFACFGFVALGIYIFGAILREPREEIPETAEWGRYT